jgi:hypothetical protein
MILGNTELKVTAFDEKSGVECATGSMIYASDFSSQLYNRSCFYVKFKDILTPFLSIYYNAPTWFVDVWIKLSPCSNTVSISGNSGHYVEYDFRKH